MTPVPRLQRTLWLLLVILPLSIPAVGQEKPAAEDASTAAEASVALPAGALFLAFNLIRIIPYFIAMAYGALLGRTIPLWDETLLTIDARTENTLWLGYSVVIGVAVTVAVEYVFHRVHPITDLTLATESRLQAVEDVLRQIAADLPVSGKLEKDISLYSALGTSRARLGFSGQQPGFLFRFLWAPERVILHATSLLRVEYLCKRQS
jgi:hypothetical protein